MRLDKFVCDCTGLTRSQAGKLIRQGEIQLNGLQCKQPAQQIKETDVVLLDDEPLQLTGPRYILLHKPAGYVCSTDDPDHNTVFVLLDEPNIDKLHTVGRLDLDTTGLLLITDDGQWSHKISSPKHECAKTYRAWLADPVEDSAIAQFAEGVMLRGEKTPTKPAQPCLSHPPKPAESSPRPASSAKEWPAPTNWLPPTPARPRPAGANSAGKAPDTYTSG